MCHTRILFLALFAAVVGSCSDSATPTDATPVHPSLERIFADTKVAILPLFAPADDDRLFVVQQEGTVAVAQDGQVQPEPFLDLRGVVSPVSGQGRGLLSMAFHPEYQENGEFFVSYTTQDAVTTETISRIDRVRVSPDPNRADPASRVRVFEIPQSLGDHNGGHILFGPDGMLYIMLGDGGSGLARGEAQNRESHLGTIVRLDVTGVSPYRIPSDNPFIDDPVVPPEVLAWGVRNPWRSSFDLPTGDLWVADVGEERWEEVTVIRNLDPRRTDLNLGWAAMEGPDCFDESSCTPSDYLLPTFYYPHEEGCSIVGGFVYRGATFSQLYEHYVFADFCEAWIRTIPAFDVQGTGVDLGLDLEGEHPISFGIDNVSELYISTLEGSVFRLTVAEG